jgi:16S rRNA (uracil1498-N3)-methyltransferase
VTTPHFFVEALASGQHALLSDLDSRHALRSLRLRAGDRVSLADGRGMVATGILQVDSDGRAAAQVEELWTQPTPGPALSVAVSPPKGERLSWVIQKLAELGVDELTIIQTERSVRSWTPARTEHAMGRLRAIAREACMQARRPTIMEVWGPFKLSGVLDFEGTVMLSEAGKERLSDVLPAEAPVIRLIVGPEGGFTERELRQAADAGVATASLGPNNLRTETAAVVGATLALARYGRLG